MPSPEFNIVQSVTRAVQYTGSNSTDIDAQVPNLNFVSEDSGVLTMDLGGNEFVVHTTEWVIWNAFMTTTLSNNQYLHEWGCIALCSDLSEVTALGDDLSDLTDDVSDLNTAITGAFVRAMGTAAVPTLLLGQNTTVAVQLQPAMPDATYAVYASAFGGVNLGGLSITSVSVVDADTVNVAVNNVGGLTVSGVTLLVHAID